MPIDRNGGAVGETARRVVSKRPTSSELPEARGSVGPAGRWVALVGQLMGRSGAAGLSGSLVLHVLILLVFSLLVLDQFRDAEPLSTEWSQSEDGPPSLPESAAAAELELESAAERARQVPRINTALLDGREDVLDDVLSAAMLEYVADFDSEAATTSGGLLQAPDGARVVKQGSFSVWTVPKDPLPEQEYKIVIQIRLPDVVRRYRAADLSGEVEGSDGYRQQIPWDPKWKGRTDVALTIRDGRLVPLRKGGFLPVHDRITQLVIRVPPARRLVRDRIKIRSKLLKEQQLLEIVF